MSRHPEERSDEGRLDAEESPNCFSRPEASVDVRFVMINVEREPDHASMETTTRQTSPAPTMKSFKFSRAIVAALLAAACRGRQPRDRAILDGFRSIPCNPAITVISPDLDLADACRLATLSRREVAAGAGQQRDIWPRDTTLLDSALVMQMSVLYPEGEPTQHYWSVTFRPRGRATSIGARIDRITGRIDVAQEEPLSLWPISWHR